MFINLFESMLTRSTINEMIRSSMLFVKRRQIVGPSGRVGFIGQDWQNEIAYTETATRPNRRLGKAGRNRPREINLHKTNLSGYSAASGVSNPSTRGILSAPSPQLKSS